MNETLNQEKILSIFIGLYSRIIFCKCIIFYLYSSNKIWILFKTIAALAYVKIVVMIQLRKTNYPYLSGLSTNTRRTTKTSVHVIPYAIQCDFHPNNYGTQLNGFDSTYVLDLCHFYIHAHSLLSESYAARALLSLQSLSVLFIFLYYIFSIFSLF
jgi:hypothetical protein